MKIHSASHVDFTFPVYMFKKMLCIEYIMIIQHSVQTFTQHNYHSLSTMLTCVGELFLDLRAAGAQLYCLHNGFVKEQKLINTPRIFFSPPGNENTVHTKHMDGIFYSLGSSSPNAGPNAGAV